jgi:hypothetical protein
MFLNEITPILKEITKEPVAFCSGFVSGILRLNLSDDPVKTWLEKQAGFTPTSGESSTARPEKPKSINID